MANYSRTDRVSEEIKRELSAIITRFERPASAADGICGFGARHKGFEVC